MTAVEVEQLEKAKNAFGEMQRSWWNFAEIIYEVFKNESYREVSYETFKDYCESEFPSMNFKTITKYVAIAERLGTSLKEKLKKDELYALPSYEACYTIVTLKDVVVTDVEFAKIKRDVLEKKISYYKLREKLKDLADSKSKERASSLNKSEDEIEKLTKMLEADIDESDIDTDDDFSSEEEELSDFHEELPECLDESDYTGVRHPSFDKALILASELSDELELIEDSLNSIRFNKKIETFANKLNKTYTLLDQLLEKIEGMQS